MQGQCSPLMLCMGNLCLLLTIQRRNSSQGAKERRLEQQRVQYGLSSSKVFLARVACVSANSL
jgi:hypothetical protein